MLVLGIETSCDETGLAVYDTGRGLLAHALHSQVAMHSVYGGVVPELASRDHVRRVVPLAQRVLAEAGARLADLDGIAYTQGPGLAGALLVGASVATALGYALGQARGRRPSHGRPSAVAAARRSEAGVSVRRAARLGRPQPAVRGRGRRAVPAAGRHEGRRRRRGLRQDGQAARAAVSRRTGAGEPGRGGTGWRRGAAATDARQRRPRHELQRTEDGGADARAPRGGRRDARRRAPGRHRARVPARGGRCPRGEGGRRAGRDGARAGSSWPGAWAPIASSARGSSPRSAGAADRCSSPISSSAPTTAR